MIIDTPTTIAELRLLIAIKLAVAPRHWFTSLAKPKSPAHERDKVREKLVEFMTCDIDKWSFSRPVNDSARGHLTADNGGEA